jgi:hypothetical protein
MATQDLPSAKAARAFLAALSDSRVADVDLLSALAPAGSNTPLSALVLWTNANGKSLLHHAAQLRDDGALITRLVRLGGDPNLETNRGHTPLIFAAARGNGQVVLALLDAGGRVRVRTVKGDSALSHADKLPPHAAAALHAAEAAEEGAWRDFRTSPTALAAQAMHTRVCRSCSAELREECAEEHGRQDASLAAAAGAIVAQALATPRDGVAAALVAAALLVLRRDEAVVVGTPLPYVLTVAERAYPLTLALEGVLEGALSRAGAVVALHSAPRAALGRCVSVVFERSSTPSVTAKMVIRAVVEAVGAVTRREGYEEEEESTRRRKVEVVAVPVCVVDLPPELPFHTLPPSVSVTWVDSRSGLAALMAALEGAASVEGGEGTRRLAVGVDCEWWGGETPSIVQIAIEEAVWVVDTGLGAEDSTALEDVTRALCATLATLFAHPRFRVHGFSFGHDRMRLEALVPGIDVTGVLDLQRSPALRAACRDAQPSLALACAALLHLRLDKAQQCSHWAARPLSPQQLAYAALDAHVLLPLSRAC